MASYNELLALIDAYINQNGVQAITGQVLNGVLRAMVDQLGRGYAIMGTAVPSTDPGTPDGPESWFASTPGTYTDMGGLTVANAELALLSYTPSDGWAKTTLTQGIVSTSASVNNQVGTPSVTSSYVDGVLTFTFENLKGNTGDPAGFGTVSASVDDQIGTPAVSVQTSGPDTAKNIVFAFRNLKGETGVTSVVATVDNTVGSPSCAVSLVGQELHLDFTGLKGAQGDTGVSADYPITIANNLTTNDPTAALSAAMGVQLESEISQLEHEVDGLDIQVNGQAEDTAEVTLAVTAGTGVTYNNSLKTILLKKGRTYRVVLSGAINVISMYFRNSDNTGGVTVDYDNQGASGNNISFSSSVKEHTITPRENVYYIRFYSGASNITVSGDMVFSFNSPETGGLVEKVGDIENDVEGLGTQITTVDDNINERIDTELYDTELLTADSSSQTTYDTSGNPVSPSILDTYFYGVAPGEILDLDYVPFSSAGYSVIQAWNDATFVESILDSKVVGYGTIRYVVPEGVNKIGCTYYTNNVHKLTSKIETLSKEIDAVDDKVDKSAFVKTRNVWPIDTTVSVTETNVVYGVQGTTIIPAGTYILSYEAILESGSVWAELIGYDSQGSVSILHQAGQTNGRRAKGVVFERDIDRLLFKTYNNNVGEIVLKDIQIEAIDWKGYTASPNKGDWEALPYGTEFIKQVVPVNELVGTYKSYWEGKKINYNGDSVTQGIGTSRIGYAKVVNQALKFGTVRNYAIGGTRLAHVEDVVNCLVDRIEDMSLDADIVFIMANTNDYASQVPIGATDSNDESTYNGALNSIFTWLKANYPTQPIIISTMLTRKVNYNDQSQPLPITIEQYANAVRAKVEEYKFILYDAYEWSGLDQKNTPKDGTGISDDGLHPNEAGALALGRKIAKFIDSQ